MKSNLQQFIDIQTKRAFSLSILDEFKARGLSIPSYSSLHDNGSIPSMLWFFSLFLIDRSPSSHFSIIGNFVNNLCRAIPSQEAFFDENAYSFIANQDLVLTSDHFFQLISLSCFIAFVHCRMGLSTYSCIGEYICFHLREMMDKLESLIHNQLQSIRVSDVDCKQKDFAHK